MKNTPTVNKEILNHKAHKEHKDFLFVFLPNPKSQILNPNLLFYFSNIDISFNSQTELHRKKIKYVKP